MKTKNSPTPLVRASLTAKILPQTYKNKTKHKPSGLQSLLGFGTGDGDCGGGGQWAWDDHKPTQLDAVQTFLSLLPSSISKSSEPRPAQEAPGLK